MLTGDDEFDEKPAEPVADTNSGIWATALEAGRRGLREGLTDTAQSLDPFTDRAAEASQASDPVSRLLSQKISEGWSDPHWWAAHIAHGITSSSPTLAGTLAGGAIGAETPIPGGTLLGAAAAGAFGSALQTIAPAYRRARADGLDAAGKIRSRSCGG